MEVTIRTSDPNAVSADDVAAALTAAGYYVASVEVIDTYADNRYDGRALR